MTEDGNMRLSSFVQKKRLQLSRKLSREFDADHSPQADIPSLLK